MPSSLFRFCCGPLSYGLYGAAPLKGHLLPSRDEEPHVDLEVNIPALILLRQWQTQGADERRRNTADRSDLIARNGRWPTGALMAETRAAHF